MDPEDEHASQARFKRDLAYWDQTHLSVERGAVVVVRSRLRRRESGKLLPVFSPDVWDTDLEMQRSVNELKGIFAENLRTTLKWISADVLALDIEPAGAREHFCARARNMIDEYAELWRDRTRKLATVMEERVRKRYPEYTWSVRQSEIDGFNRAFDGVAEPVLKLATLDFQEAAHRATRDRKDHAGSELRRQTDVQFPNRASWLAERLYERSWNKHDVWRRSGPDHKTIQKILDGERVREDVLEKLAKALSQKGRTVEVTEIPRD